MDTIGFNGQRFNTPDIDAVNGDFVAANEACHIAENNVELIAFCKNIFMTKDDGKKAERQQDHQHKSAYGYFHRCLTHSTFFHRSYHFPIRLF